MTQRQILELDDENVTKHKETLTTAVDLELLCNFKKPETLKALLTAINPKITRLAFVRPKKDSYHGITVGNGYNISKEFIDFLESHRELETFRLNIMVKQPDKGGISVKSMWQHFTSKAEKNRKEIEEELATNRPVIKKGLMEELCKLPKLQELTILPIIPSSDNVISNRIDLEPVLKQLEDKLSPCQKISIGHGIINANKLSEFLEKFKESSRELELSELTISLDLGFNPEEKANERHNKREALLEQQKELEALMQQPQESKESDTIREKLDEITKKLEALRFKQEADPTQVIKEIEKQINLLITQLESCKNITILSSQFSPPPIYARFPKYVDCLAWPRCYPGSFFDKYYSKINIKSAKKTAEEKAVAAVQPLEDKAEPATQTSALENKDVPQNTTAFPSVASNNIGLFGPTVTTVIPKTSQQPKEESSFLGGIVNVFVKRIFRG